MRKLPVLILFLALFAAATAFSPSAEAINGPVGLNQMRTEAGPGAGQITLNWSRYNPLADNYAIFYGLQSGKYIYSVPATGNTVTYTIGALTPGARYFFTLQPFSNGQSLQSVSGEISDVASAVPNQVMGTPGPFGLRGLMATKGAKGSMVLTWTRTTTTTDNYNIMYGLLPGKYIYSAINTLGASHTDNLGVQYTYSIGSLVSGTRYYFALQPMAAGVGGGITAEVSQIAP